MLMSQLYAPTLREVPAEAELISHQLMLRSGMIRKSTAGVYTYLPLGLRVLHRVMDIVREEMNRADGQEIMLPIIQPAELWHETGRWEDYGAEMFKLRDRHERLFCLGPTHEEIITALIRSEVRSYRQLPLRLYQIQNKYRDEIRPRFGVMRGREFIMKDLYSFDKDEEQLQESYTAMYEAYERIFARCGLDTRPVEADSGTIGGDMTHEFMVLAESGEAQVVYCDSCSYAANVEKAEVRLPEVEGEDAAETMQAMARVDTPGVTTIEQLESFLGSKADRFVKTMLYMADEKPVAALVRGDHTLNEVKLQKHLGCTTLALADSTTIEKVTGAPVGFAGPVGLSLPIVADCAVPVVRNAVVGGNERDLHLTGVNFERDYNVDTVGDLRQAEAGDGCPRCSGTLVEAYGIEVGQVFKLGTKYSEPLNAAYLDESGRERLLLMGCYGIGVSRTVAAIIEQNHDEDGICWPVSVAPYQAVVIPINPKDETQRDAAEAIYRSLSAESVSVVLDDRNERPGVKFKDADLIGFPLRIVIGPKTLANGQVEIGIRKTKEKYTVPVDDAAQEAAKAIQR